jgi:competence protein ComEC
MHIFASFLSGIVLFSAALFFPLTSALLFASSALLLAVRKRFLLIFFIILGFTYAFSRHTPHFDPSSLPGREVMVVCTADDQPSELSSGRWMNEVRVSSAVDARTGEDIIALKGREMRILSDEGLRDGFRYTITVDISRDMERMNPGALKSEKPSAYLREVKGTEEVGACPITAWLKGRREKLNRYVKDTIGGDAGALLSAFTTGLRTDMSDTLKDAFNSTGLVHLVSISGTHFGLFSMLVFGIFRLIIMSMPYAVLQRVTLYFTPSQVAATVSLPFMLLYLLISGYSIPAVRSFIMITVFLVGLLIQRKGFWLNSLLFAACMICLWDPSAILSISFQLSFLAVFFIGVFVVDREQEKTGGSRVLRVLTGPLFLTLSASLGTAPLVAYYFHYVSIISPLANLLITPFIGFIVVPLSLVSAFTFIFSGHYPFTTVIAALYEASIKGVMFCASVPFADMAVPAFPLVLVIVFYAGIGVYLLGGRRSSLLVVPLLPLIFFLVVTAAGRRDMSVTYLDVGQGDSAVVKGFSGKTIVVDTGRTGREVEGYLRFIGKRAIDALVITHADGDHSGGMGFLMKRFTVREVWDNGLLIYPDGLLKDARHRSLERGDETMADGLTVQVFHPYRGFYTFAENDSASVNNDSLVLKITGRETSFLFTADAAEEAEDDMLHLGRWLRSDVMKVSHHGSGSASSAGFINAVSPELAVISVGRYNSYGHPHQDILERYQGVKLYRTDRDGAVKITERPFANGERLTVKTGKDFLFERARSIGGEWRNLRRLFTLW